MRRIVLPLICLGLSSGAAASETVVVDRAICRRLAQHVPAGDVAFQPGVGPGGRPVAAADLSPAPASGLVSYNGQPLGDPELARLAKLCQSNSPLPAADAAPK
ncbi:MAG: hypothetical protein FJX68_00160 [Alphaproteobacteria bacterium]|nr:hypothetical protein [Alphaproteobacteria bacterium]